MHQPIKQIVFGELIGIGPNLACEVRLASGEIVAARIPKHVARMMFRVAPGDRIAIKRRGSGPFVVLGHEQTVIDERLVEYLCFQGKSSTDWFLLGDMPCFWSGEGGIGHLLTSDNQFYAALCDYLKRSGAPIFESYAEAENAGKLYARLRDDRKPRPTDTFDSEVEN
jgi:translation initiation factor IF-1